MQSDLSANNWPSADHLLNTKAALRALLVVVKR
jgi:hypothetical protein